jgi:membrane associated rhomboid family serine protease
MKEQLLAVSLNSSDLSISIISKSLITIVSHSSLTHLSYNLMSFILLGAFLEKKLKKKKLIIFILFILLANIITFNIFTYLFQGGIVGYSYTTQALLGIATSYSLFKVLSGISLDGFLLSVEGEPPILEFYVLLIGFSMFLLQALKFYQLNNLIGKGHSNLLHICGLIFGFFILIIARILEVEKW